MHALFMNLYGSAEHIISSLKKAHKKHKVECKGVG